MSVVKRQHYVWRAYLRAWADKESIWTRFKTMNKVLKTSLMGVAQEKYFYKLVDFTADEEAFLTRFINQKSPEAVKALNLDFLALFTSTSKLKQLAAGQPDYEEEIRKMEINLMEIAHGKMENLGQRFIACRSLDDLKAMEEDDSIFEAIMFLCFQYFRTRKMREATLSSFAGTTFEDLVKRAWGIMSYVMATTLAYHISLDPNLRLILHENKTGEHFMTCDQPVFNLLGDQVDEHDEVTMLELYYPLAPEYALTIHFRNDQAEKYTARSADLAAVAYYNEAVIANADYAVFADNQPQLTAILP